MTLSALVAILMLGETIKEPLDTLKARLPETVGVWRADQSSELYDTQTIYSYIDGHAEVYLAYGMKACLAQRYLPPTGDAVIVLDVFRMPLAADAFGVFSRDQEGDPIDLGQEAVLRSSWLSFWKGSYYVSVYAEDESEGVQAAIVELGRSVANAIQETGVRPALLRQLPQQGLLERSVRYLRDPQSLRYHVPDIRGNPLSIDEKTPVVLAQYRRENARALLLVVEYESAEAARSAAAVARNAGFIDASPIRRARIVQNRLGVVLHADTEELAMKLLRDLESQASSLGGAR